MLNLEEAQCEDYFSKTQSGSPVGKYTVRLSFNSSVSLLDDSLSRALQASSSLLEEHACQAQQRQTIPEALYGFYAIVPINDMERVQENQVKVKTFFYYPYQGELRGGSTTTELRVIFNGSVRSSSGSSS